MVQGLGFLSKKSWHTKNLSNQKRVWEEEQKQAAEASKTKELAKQIQQEREQEELDKIAGKKTAMDRGIDWMYQGGTQGDLAKQDAEKKAEEYLLGKEFVGEGAVQGDFDGGEEQTGINNVVLKAPPQEDDRKPAAYAEPSVHDRNEQFCMRNEDPMFFVSQKVREKEKKRDDTKELYERVVGYEEDSRKRSKKERKRHKKKKHRKSSRRHRDDYSDVDSSEDSRRKSRKRHRRRHRSRSRSRSRSGSRDRHHKRHRSRRDDAGYDSRSEDSYDDRGRHDHRRDRHHDKHRRHHNDDDDHHRRDRRDRDDHRDHHRHEHSDRKEPPSDQPGMKKLEGYGLKGAPAPKIDKNDLGPDRELLRQKKEARESERRRNAEISQARKRSSQEDRKRALEEMQEDARKREERKGHQASYRKSDNTNDADYEAGKGPNASFLNDITKQTHGLAGGESLSSRVAQNRHTNQRLHDSFL